MQADGLWQPSPVTNVPLGTYHVLKKIPDAGIEPAALRLKV